MDIEFHYYITHLIALRAGFKKGDARIIAYSSQYTDDNDVPLRIEDGETPYDILISQTMDPQKPQLERLSIYPAFHFCPGTQEEMFKYAPLRRDGKFHLLTTIPDNSNAIKIFKDALQSGSPYRIGIGTHMYADTFCHRDFAGWKDDFNWMQLKGFVGGLWSAVGPAIGHALAMHNPDIPPLVWEDTRLTSKYSIKKNKEQILKATEKIFDFYCNFTKPGKDASSDKKKLLGEVGEAIGNEVEEDSSKDTRITNYKDILGADYTDYEKQQWFDDAVIRVVEGVATGLDNMKYKYLWKKDYKMSNWYAFQEAVKQHHNVALNVLKGTYELMEISEKRLTGSIPTDNV